MQILFLRALIAAAALAVPVSGGVATAQVSTQPLAPGEVLLEVVAVGTAEAPADRATLTATVAGSGANEEEAERALEAATERVRAAARAAGVGSEDISSTEVPLTIDADLARPDPGFEETPPATRRRALEMELRDVARVDAVRDALIDAGAASVSDPSYSLSDGSASRGAARTDALRAARAQAEAYAADLGLRVVRIVRVSERVGMDIFNIAISDPGFARRMQPNRANTDPRVESFMFVGVDFALAPR